MLPLGLTSATRLESNPEFPTIASSGLPGYEVLTWYGVFAPGATPPAVVAKIQTDMARIIASAEVKDRLHRDGVQAVGSKPEEFATFVRKEIEKVTKLVRAGGIRPD